jgi:hypothetical protein
VEIIEAFCAEHNVGIDEVLYDWPSSKFEAFYNAYIKRKVADELQQRRISEVAALWGNPNLDNPKDETLRQKVMEQVEENFHNAYITLYSEEDQIKDEEIPEDDPFFKAMEKGIEKRQLPEMEIDQADE